MLTLIKKTISRAKDKVRYELIAHELRTAQEDMANLGVHIGELIREKERIKRNLTEAELYELEQTLDYQSPF